MQLIDSTNGINQRREGAGCSSALTFWWPAVLLLLAFLAIPAQAQYRTSIQGVVTDPQGALIPGATLTLNNLSTNLTIVRTSNDAGVFNFNALPADHFTLSVEREGFKKKVLNDLQLIPEQANALNVQLELGEVTQTVSVDASLAPAMDTQTASTGATISSNQIGHMPVFGRDVFQLSQLVPGAISDGSQSSGGGTNTLPGSQGASGPAASDGIFKTENGPQIDANGGQVETNSITIDGISTISAVWGGTTVITPTADSVENIRIVTNSYDAENGRFSGSQTIVTSKSGSNNVHGNYFFQANRPGLNAYQRYNGPAFNNTCDPTSSESCAVQKGLNRDSQQFNQSGGSVSGPIWKNKIFAFFAYETIRNNSSVTGTGWYDTADFDALASSSSIASKFLTFTGHSVASSGIISATCADVGLTETVNCNTITGKGLNIGSPLTSVLGTQDLTASASTTPGVGGGLSTTVADIANYATINPTKLTETQYNGRMDADVTGKDHLAFAIYWVPVSKTNYNGGARAYNLFHHDAINDAFSLIWNHTFSPNFLNEARANAAGWRWNEITDNPQAPVGLPQVNISYAGNTSLNSFGSALGSNYNQWTYTYKDVATKVSGRHTIKFGGELTRLEYLNNPVGRPGYNFYNIWDFLNDAPKTEYGNFDTATGLPGGSRADDRENLLGFFVQDDWKVSSNLTVNAGLRYNYFGSLNDKQSNLSVAQFGTGTAYMTGLRLSLGNNLWTPQKGNFGPQIGFNWSPKWFHDKLVVRGGYGLNYNQEEIAISGNVNNNPPAASWYWFDSNSPTSINADIVYGVSTDIHSLSGFASNSHTITTYNGNNLPIAGNGSITAVPNNMPTAYSEHYSLGAEYDLGHHLIASLGYQGSSSHHLITQYNANVIAAAQGLTLNPLVTYVDYYANSAASNNNMMLAVLKHQFSQHFSADAQFTWAKSMDNGSGPYEEDPYPYNRHYSYGRSDFNVGKSFKLFGMWQPVFYHGNQKWVGKVADGWSLSGILNLHSGFGWTPMYYASGNFYYSSSGYNSMRPTYLGGAGNNTSNDTFKPGPNKNFTDIDSTVVSTATSYSNKYFSVADYSTALAGSSYPGVASALPPAPGIARNSFNGPGYRDVDFTMTKSFGLPKLRYLGDSANFEIRMDAYNIFNLLNFSPSSISNNITSTNFGQAGSALGSRTIDLQARFNF
jgi:hypothetical protein